MLLCNQGDKKLCVFLMCFLPKIIVINMHDLTSVYLTVRERTRDMMTSVLYMDPQMPYFELQISQKPYFNFLSKTVLVTNVFNIKW